MVFDCLSVLISVEGAVIHYNKNISLQDLEKYKHLLGSCFSIEFTTFRQSVFCTMILYVGDLAIYRH